MGSSGKPTTFLLVRPGPGNWVCFWYQTIIRWTVTRARIRPGITSTCTVYRRGMKSWPGNSPPKAKKESQVPTTGTARMIASAIRRPVPDSRSSGSE